jgi:hypothetical protein
MTALRPACLDALRAISAGRDDPMQAAAAARARRHLDTCPVCAALVDDADSVDEVLAAVRRRRPSRSATMRAVLGVAAVLQCILAIPWLFGANPFAFVDSMEVDPSHLTRDGAIGIIIGVAGLTTAIRPRHAFAMLVTASAAVGMQVLSFAIDEGHERVHPLFETSHVLAPVVLVLVAVLALRKAPPVGPPGRDRGAPHDRHLRAV